MELKKKYLKKFINNASNENKLLKLGFYYTSFSEMQKEYKWQWWNPFSKRIVRIHIHLVQDEVRIVTYINKGWIYGINMLMHVPYQRKAKRFLNKLIKKNIIMEE